MLRSSLLVLVGLLPSLSAQASDLYVVYTLGNTVNRFSSTGTNLGTFTQTYADFAETIALDSQGYLYVASTYSDYLHNGPTTLRKFSPTGANLGVVTTGIKEFSLAVDRYDNVYVAKDGTIQRFTSNGTSLGTFYSGPVGDTRKMTFDNAGNLYYVDRQRGIIKLSPSGTKLNQFPFAAGNADSPNGIAIDSSGNILVSDYFGSAIYKLGPDGTDLGIFATTGVNSSRDIKFDLNGILYVANSEGPPFDGYQNSIHRFDTSGQDLGTFANTGNNSAPEGLAFIPVRSTGDFNGDGKVDAADYVVWRKDPSSHGGQEFYGIWRANYGRSISGSGSSIEHTTFPEPSSLLLLAISAIRLLSYRKR